MYPENKKASSGIYFILLFKMMKLQIPSQSLSRSRLMLLHSCHTDKKTNVLLYTHYTHGAL